MLERLSVTKQIPALKDNPAGGTKDMFENNKVLAALYFIAFVACFVTFLGRHSWGYLVASVIWLMLGIYCLVRKDDDLG